MPDKDAIMHRWDIIRSKLQKGHSGSEPRDIFENILEDYEEELKQEREAREQAERERDELLRTFAHTHVSIPPSKKVDLDDDTCAKCGLDIRHPVHIRGGEEMAFKHSGEKQIIPIQEQLRQERE